MSKQICLRGNRIYLRKFKKSDINNTYISWLKDPVVTQFMHAASKLISKKNLLQYYDNFKNNKNDFLFAVIINKNKKHIGNVRLGPVEWAHRRTEFGIMIGDKKNWGQGYASEAVKLILNYAFTDLKLNKINIGVVEENKPAIHLYRKSGFKKEGCIRNNFYLNGKYLNSIRMGMLKSEFVIHGNIKP